MKTAKWMYIHFSDLFSSSWNDSSIIPVAAVTELGMLEHANEKNSKKKSGRWPVDQASEI